jgi:phage tail-like protein
MSVNKWDLPVAFYFQVFIAGVEFSFKEVSGLGTEMEVETIVEGGLNDYTHVVPKRIKHGNLVLKRALKTSLRADTAWLMTTLDGGVCFPIIPNLVIINLLDKDAIPLYSWTCSDAYPVKWEAEALDSEKNSVLIESLELTYSTIRRMPWQL